MNDNYITVTEFAKKAGISKQYVYQNLEKRFKPYYKVINGKKVLDTAVFDVVTIKEPQDLKDINIVKPNHDLVRALQDQIDLLKNQITVKDQQLAEKDHQLAEYADHLKAEQMLRMAADERLALLEDKHTEQDTQEPAQQDPEPVADPLTVSRENPSKISFWERIRKRLH